jgi:hypothetical protein
MFHPSEISRSLTSTFPASAYWGINESILYGSTTILSTTAGVVDTGKSPEYVMAGVIEMIRNRYNLDFDCHGRL